MSKTMFQSMMQCVNTGWLAGLCSDFTGHIQPFDESGETPQGI